MEWTLKHAATWKNLENIMLSEMLDTKTQILSEFFMRYTEEANS